MRDDNRWIISSYKFHEHKDPTAARAELERLQAKCPDKKFRVYRVKRVVELPEEPSTREVQS